MDSDRRKDFVAVVSSVHVTVLGGILLQSFELQFGSLLVAAGVMINFAIVLKVVVG